MVPKDSRFSAIFLDRRCDKGDGCTYPDVLQSCGRSDGCSRGKGGARRQGWDSLDVVAAGPDVEAASAADGEDVGGGGVVGALLALH